MWDKLTLLPLFFQSWVCPSRTSDVVLLCLLTWAVGVITGAVATALILSPGLRRFLLRGLAFVLVEVVPEAARRTDRLQRYRQ